MTREQVFLDRWHLEREAYLAWGRMISSTVQEELASVIAPVPADYFLRTPVAPRLKEDFKLVEKAFYRGKGYSSPYDDITDKVGTRFVVLLGTETRTVEQVVISVPGWTFSKDRDYEEEQNKNPLRFDYAALHYVVRPTDNVQFEGVHIPKGTPCEVQIKTILQHAYSELTHDTIYKPQIEATPSMQRSAAKAMALLEATNDYFEKVTVDVDEVLSRVRTMTAMLSEVYQDLVGIAAKPSVLEGIIQDAYSAQIQNDDIEAIKTFFNDHRFLGQCIRTHIDEKNPLFTQPSVLMVYFLARKSIRKLQRDWPLTTAELNPLLNDLGENID